MDWDDDDLEDGYWDPDDYPFRRGEPLNDEGFMDEDLEDDGRDDYNDRQLDLLEGCCDEAEQCYDAEDLDEAEDPYDDPADNAAFEHSLTWEERGYPIAIPDDLDESERADYEEWFRNKYLS